MTDVPTLTHVDPQGGVRMVDVSDKPDRARTAVAAGRVLLGPEAYERVEALIAKGRGSRAQTLADLLDVVGVFDRRVGRPLVGQLFDLGRRRDGGDLLVLAHDALLATPGAGLHLAHGDDHLTTLFLPVTLQLGRPVLVPEQTSQTHWNPVPSGGSKRTPSPSDARQTPGNGKTTPVVGGGMRAKREYRDRAEIEVAVLDALVDRADDGMTVFEVRAAVEADIDAIEDALGALKADGLIEVEHESERVRILPADRVVPDPSEELDEEESFIVSTKSEEQLVENAENASRWMTYGGIGLLVIGAGIFLYGLFLMVI